MSDSFKKQHFAEHAPDDEPYDDDWFSTYFEESHEGFYLIYSGETDCGNFASGDESWEVYEEPPDFVRVEGKLKRLHGSAYWGRNSSGGVYGPLETIDEVGKALGFDKDVWSETLDRINSGGFDEDEEEQ